MRTRILRLLSPLLIFVVLGLALGVLHHVLREYHYRDVINHLSQLPTHRIFLALGFTALSYFLLTLYDALAVRYIGTPLRLGQTSLTGFINYAINNNIGFGGLAGNSLRYRFYTSWGLSAIAVTQLIGFCILTFWLGFLTTGGVSFLLSPPVIPEALHFPLHTVRPLGLLLLAPVMAYLALTTVLHKRTLKIRDWDFTLPSPGMSVQQLILATADWTIAACALYVLLPPDSNLHFSSFLSIFLLSQIIGLISHVPGGLGVFETIMTLCLQPFFAPPTVLVSLLAYRGIYYLLPLIMAVSLLGGSEVARRRHHFLVMARWASAIVPNVFAVAAFLAGTLLLFSGATPGEHERLRALYVHLPRWLYHHLPLFVINVSHFLGGVAGMGLLLLARGLQRRLDAAYLMTVTLLGLGIVLSLFKGFDYEEALVLSALLLAFLPCHAHFHRKASLISERFTPGWIVAIAVAFIASLWLGFFSYKKVQYSAELWLSFRLHDDPARFLRASLGAFAVALVFSLNMLLRPAQPEPTPLTPEQWERVRAIAARSRRTQPWSALLRDKYIMLSKSENAFIMYGIEGRCWVALGDPVGPREEVEELAWQFREQIDRHDGWTVFYQVYPDQLPLYLDLGLTLLKLGEEAMVPLEEFSLEGSRNKGLRHSRNTVEREGYAFEIIPRDDVAPFLPDLRAISDAWLEEKKTREKSFSLGYFDETYLQEFPVALVRREGRIVAFANLWLGAERDELSLDLMRHLPGEHGGLMDYLFINLMLWGKEQGYRWFNLGMAPLSGLDNRALAPLWNRIGAAIFRHGEHFYNFQGLRQYKSKFDPVWVPKYLASPGGLLLPRILTNVASLIAGGVKGIIGK